MSVYLDIYMGNKDEHAQEEAAYSRTVSYCKQETPNLFGAAVTPEELDDGQRATVESVYDSNPSLSSQGPMRFTKPDPLCVGRVEIKLYTDKCPKACENFQALCTGEKGAGKIAKSLHYLGCPFHRLVKGKLLQAGDITRHDGSGGESIWKKTFNDEKTGLAIKFDSPGLLAMANSGKNSNTSQFFLTLQPLPQLSGKHVVFGEVISGMDVLTKVDQTAAVGDGSPSIPVWIGACGKL